MQEKSAVSPDTVTRYGYPLGETFTSPGRIVSYRFPTIKADTANAGRPLERRANCAVARLCVAPLCVFGGCAVSPPPARPVASRLDLVTVTRKLPPGVSPPIIAKQSQAFTPSKPVSTDNVLDAISLGWSRLGGRGRGLPPTPWPAKETAMARLTLSPIWPLSSIPSH
jgi:hypothetical protein